MIFSWRVRVRMGRIVGDMGYGLKERGKGGLVRRFCWGEEGEGGREREREGGGR